MVFDIILSKIIPLYIFVALGWIAGRAFKTDLKTVSNIAIFFTVPPLILKFVADIPFNVDLFAMPLVTFLTGTTLAFLNLKLGRFIYHDSHLNLMASSAGMGNVGYFGLPIALAIFNDYQVSFFMLGILGSMLYQSTYCYYLLARSNFTIWESIIKLLKLPYCYAFTLGLIYSYFKLQLPEFFMDIYPNFQGTYVMLGMMIIGMSLAKLEHFRFDWTFIGLTFLTKFILWPLIVLGLIWIDQTTTGIFNKQIYPVLILFSLMPLAANQVGFAASLNVQTDKIASAIFVSTVFAAIYVPLMLIWLAP